MKKNLFIGNLAYTTDDESLRQHFAVVGEVVSAKVVTDRETGRSRGFGFVEFADEANNQKAVAELDGKELDGRAINVNEARPREERSDRPRRDDRNNDRNNGGGNGSFRQRSW